MVTCVLCGVQDAIGEATDKRTGERDLDGSKYYDVEIDSPVRQIHAAGV